MVRRRRRRIIAALVAGSVSLLAACSSAGVTTTQSRQHVPPTTAPPTVPTGPLPDIGPVEWHGCPEDEAPLECASIEVPLDYDDPDGTALTIALVRLPATDPDRRVGSLLVNPGGPGGSGIRLVRREAANIPPTMREALDIIGFDPRGVGASNGVRCPAALEGGIPSFGECIAADAELLPHLGTPNVARDVEMIRRALGEEQISYLGYSYGTAIGALYADMFPASVRAMVLDGAIDPDAGLSNTPAGGIDFYAEQDFDGTLDDFQELCDLTTECPAGPHADDLIRRVRKKVSSLPTAGFPGGERVTRSDLDEILTGAMYSARNWPVLAIALDDADNGDASTLAALRSYLLYGYPADAAVQLELQFANVAVRCADFANRDDHAFVCADFPETDEALPVVAATDVDTPIVVVGTKGDPATPSRYSPLLAEALDDAVAIEWLGSGHTATLTSRCITDIVAEYLVALVVPDDGTTCDFVTDESSLADTADVVFGGADRLANATNTTSLLVSLGEDPARAACIGRGLSLRASQRALVDVQLGVESAELQDVRALVERACG